MQWSLSWEPFEDLSNYTYMHTHALLHAPGEPGFRIKNPYAE